MDSFADNFALVIEGASLHPEEKPFCYDPSCPCHEDADEITILNYHVEEGHVTPQEATDIVAGKTI